MVCVLGFSWFLLVSSLRVVSILCVSQKGRASRKHLKGPYEIKEKLLLKWNGESQQQKQVNCDGVCSNTVWKALDDVTGSQRIWHHNNKQHLHEYKMENHKPQVKTLILYLLWWERIIHWAVPRFLVIIWTSINVCLCCKQGEVCRNARSRQTP